MENILTQSELAGELFDLQELQFNTQERIVLALFALFVGSILIIGGWSLVLLITGNTAGGGPLGLLANVLRFECLTCVG